VIQELKINLGVLMKILVTAFFSFAIFSNLSMAQSTNYQCIADKLKSVNSDKWSNLSESDIDSMLQITEYTGHLEAMKASATCNKVETKTCQQEAQFISKVKSLTKDYTGCVVKIDLNNTKIYNPSMVCPLEIEEVVAEGIQVGLRDGHDCAFDVGDEISGVIVRKNSKLILE
jgi:hypothetical protein